MNFILPFLTVYLAIKCCHSQQYHVPLRPGSRATIKIWINSNTGRRVQVTGRAQLQDSPRQPCIAASNTKGNTAPCQPPPPARYEPCAPQQRPPCIPRPPPARYEPCAPQQSSPCGPTGKSHGQYNGQHSDAPVFQQSPNQGPQPPYQPSYQEPYQPSAIGPYGPPSNVRVVPAYHDATISLSPPHGFTGEVRSYIFLYAPSGGGGGYEERRWQEVEIPGGHGEVQYVLSGLQPGEKYYFTVQATSSSGNSPFSEIQSFGTNDGTSTGFQAGAGDAYSPYSGVTQPPYSPPYVPDQRSPYDSPGYYSPQGQPTADPYNTQYTGYGAHTDSPYPVAPVAHTPDYYAQYTTPYYQDPNPGEPVTQTSSYDVPYHQDPVLVETIPAGPGYDVPYPTAGPSAENGNTEGPDHSNAVYDQNSPNFVPVGVEEVTPVSEIVDFNSSPYWEAATEQSVPIPHVVHPGAAGVTMKAGGDTCDTLKSCVQCQAFGTGELSNDDDPSACWQGCPKFNATYVDNLLENHPGEKTCQFHDDTDFCTFFFSYYEDQARALHVEVKKKKDCPETPIG